MRLHHPRQCRVLNLKNVTPVSTVPLWAEEEVTQRKPRSVMEMSHQPAKGPTATKGFRVKTSSYPDLSKLGCEHVSNPPH